jgi:diguanylate cyclase (GGDEF)-like protein
MFITPKFKSFGIVYPSNISSYSDESETEQMLQILQSGDIRDSVIRKFNLSKHYEIDSTYKYFVSTIIWEYSQNVKVSKTPYEGINIEVMDKDPKIKVKLIRSKEYDILLPEILNSKIVQGEKKATDLSEKNRELTQINEDLKRNVQEIQDRLSKCPITGLYNEAFFLNYLDITFDSHRNSALLLIGLDNMTEINFNYSNEIGNETIKNLAYILSNEKEETHHIFKLQGPVFAYCITDTTKKDAISIAENIRKIVADSEAFIQKITVSIGLILFDEIRDTVKDPEDFSNSLHVIALNRLRIARNKGMNIVCSESSMDDYNGNVKNVLIADTDNMNLEVLKISLEKEGLKVFIARDGIEALNILEMEKISIVISELMLPKLDGFLIKEKMSMYSDKAKIPFILMSYQKDLQSVKRSIDLKIDNYFKKPYMLTELIGIVKNKIKGDI